VVDLPFFPLALHPAGFAVAAMIVMRAHDHVFSRSFSDRWQTGDNIAVGFLEMFDRGIDRYLKVRNDESSFGVRVLRVESRL